MPNIKYNQNETGSNAASVKFNGVSTNGVKTNGIKTNGVGPRGVQPNGVKPGGASPYGTRPNAYRRSPSANIYRINLLPPDMQLWALARQLTIAFSLIFIVSVGVCLFMYATLLSQTAAAEQKAVVAASAKKRTDAVRDETKTVQAQVQPVQDKLDFVQKVNAYRIRWIKLYMTLGQWTARSGFIYTDASVKGTSMTIKAYSPQVSDVTAYLQTMYQEPDFASVTVDKVVGFPADTRHLYYLDGHLVFADGAAPVPAAAPGAGSPSGPSDYNPDQIGPNGANNLPAGVGPPPPEIAVNYLGGFGGAGAPPQMVVPAGAAGYSPAFLKIAMKPIGPFAPPQIRDALLKQALTRVVVKTVPKGFDITVTAILKKPMTPPTPPGMPATAVAGGSAGAVAPIAPRDIPD